MPMSKPHSSVAEAKSKITPQQYAEELKTVELRDIHVTEVRCRLYSREITGPNTFSFKEEAAVQESKAEQSILEISYRLVAKSGRKKLAEIVIKYGVELGTARQLSTEFLDLYSKLTLPLHTFPYFRELVDSHFTRMGLPRLVLPLRKFMIGPDS